MFWLLCGLSFAILVPCVLVPEWKGLEKALIAEQYQAFKVAQLRKEVERETRLVEAIRSDPAVVTRLAQRDLGLYRRDERAILVGLSPVVPLDSALFVPKPLTPPGFIDQVSRLFELVVPMEFFSEPQTRTALMALATGLLVVAFTLFARRKGRRVLAQ